MLAITSNSLYPPVSRTSPDHIEMEIRLLKVSDRSDLLLLNPPTRVCFSSEDLERLASLIVGFGSW